MLRRRGIILGGSKFVPEKFTATPTPLPPLLLLVEPKTSYQVMKYCHSFISRLCVDTTYLHKYTLPYKDPATKGREKKNHSVDDWVDTDDEEGWLMNCDNFFTRNTGKLLCILHPRLT